MTTTQKGGVHPITAKTQNVKPKQSLSSLAKQRKTGNVNALEKLFAKKLSTTVPVRQSSRNPKPPESIYNTSSAPVKSRKKQDIIEEADKLINKINGVLTESKDTIIILNTFLRSIETLLKKIKTKKSTLGNLITKIPAKKDKYSMELNNIEQIEENLYELNDLLKTTINAKIKRQEQYIKAASAADAAEKRNRINIDGKLKELSSLLEGFTMQETPTKSMVGGRKR